MGAGDFTKAMPKMREGPGCRSKKGVQDAQALSSIDREWGVTG